MLVSRVVCSNVHVPCEVGRLGCEFVVRDMRELTRFQERQAFGRFEFICDAWLALDFILYIYDRSIGIATSLETGRMR